MANVFPLTGPELLLRRDLGTNGDIGNELHAKSDRIKADTEAILTDTADMQPKLGTPVTSISADIASIQADTTSISADTQDILGELANATYGLSALHTDLETVDTVVDGIATAIGTPVSSVSLDIAAVKTVVDEIAVDTDSLITVIGTPANGNVSADLLAIDSKVTGIQNNTRTTVALLEQLELPPTGDTYFYKFVVNNFDTDGNMEEPDSAPTVAVESFAGTNRSGNLSDDAGDPATTMIKDSDGRYHLSYKVTDAHPVNEGLLFTITIIEGTVTRYVDRVTRVTEEISSTFTAADRITLGDILTDTADMQPKLGTPAVDISADIAAVKGVVDDIHTVVDAIEVDTQDLQASVNLIESKDGGLTFDRATDSLEALRDAVDTLAAQSFPSKHFRAIKATAALAQGANELSNLGTAQGITSENLNIKEIRVIPATSTSTNFTVEIFEDSAATISLAKFEQADSSLGDLRLAKDIIFINQNASPSKNMYVKVTNVTDSSTSVFNIEIRGIVLHVN